MSRWAIMVVLVLASGCGGDRAALPEPPTAPSAFTNDGTADLSRTWWTVFNDTALNARIDQALVGNLTLRQAYERLQQSSAAARQAGAGRLPAIEASGRASATWSEDGGSPTEVYRVGLAVSYEVDLWGRVGAGVDAARYDLEARIEDLQAAAITISANVAGLWQQLAADHARLASHKRQLTLRQQVQKLTELRFAQGLVDATAVHAQRQQVAQIEARLVQARSSITTRGHALAVLLGQVPGAEPIPVPVLAPLPPLPSVGLPAEVLARRPDMRSAWLAVQAADRRVQVAVADRFPRLSLSADLTSTSASIEKVFDNWLLHLTGQLLAPLFDGGRRRAEVERTEAVVRERVHTYSQRMLEALREVEDALVLERDQGQVLDLLVAQQAEQDARLKRVRQRVKHGQATAVQLLEQELAGEAIALQVIDARLLLLQRRIDLHRAVAGPILHDDSETDV